MMQYIARRVMLFVPTMFFVSLIIFLLMRAVPGDAVIAQLDDSPRLTPEIIAEMRVQLGLDQSLPRQYWTWASGVMQGDLGRSFVAGVDIGDQFMRRVPWTLELAFMSVIVSVAAGIPLGAFAALWRGGYGDVGIRLVAVLMLAMPSFWIATLVLILPAAYFGWSPSFIAHSFSDDPKQHLIDMAIPALVGGLSSCAVALRMTRSQLLEVLKQDYIRTAYAKGLTGRSVYTHHAMKNAMIPVITVVGAQMGALLGGSVIMETIFGIPGLGQWTVNSIAVRDYPAIQALVTFFAFITLAINLLVDISYTWLDPRIRVG